MKDKASEIVCNERIWSVTEKIRNFNFVLLFATG